MKVAEVDLHSLLDLGFDNMPVVAKHEANLRIAAGVNGHQLFSELDRLLDLGEAERGMRLKSIVNGLMSF